MPLTRGRKFTSWGDTSQVADHPAAEFSAVLHEQLQEQSGDFFLHDEDEETPDTGLLLSWMVVCTWQGSDGEKWITYHRRPGQAVWESRGLLSEALADLGG